jgi:23S rRNA U2552 (ribose-2'-O)-methylase RlmE/FtsJ
VARSKTSQRWLKEHFDDPCVKWRSFIQGDLTEGAVVAQMLASVGDHPVDLVISDMAPI